MSYVQRPTDTSLPEARSAPLRGAYVRLPGEARAAQAPLGEGSYVQRPTDTSLPEARSAPLRGAYVRHPGEARATQAPLGEGIYVQRPTESRPLLELRGLSKTFVGGGRFRKRQDLRAVQGISLDLHRGETLGLVGESGCGKSTLARLILRLIEPTAGRVLLDGDDITALKGRALRPVRRRMQMVFQDPFASLNPRFRIRGVLAEPLRAHGIPRSDWRERMEEALDRVGLPLSHLDRFAHELSGGQRQRVGIARALILKPDLVLADEPVAALDVSIQAQVLNLMKALQAEMNLTCLFIAHDLAVVRQVSHRVGVMLLGHLVELADRDALYARPQHPYTRALLDAAPSVRPGQRRPAPSSIGELPSPSAPPPGCPFQSRCPIVRPVCRTDMPELRQIGPRHRVACHAVSVTPPVARSPR